MYMANGGIYSAVRSGSSQLCACHAATETIVGQPYATWGSDQVLKPFLVPPMIGNI